MYSEKVIMIVFFRIAVLNIHLLISSKIENNRYNVKSNNNKEK